MPHCFLWTRGKHMVRSHTHTKHNTHVHKINNKKSACFSSRGPWFSSQDPDWAAYKLSVYLQRIRYPLLGDILTYYMAPNT